MKMNYKKWPVIKWIEDKGYKNQVLLDGDLSDYLTKGTNGKADMHVVQIENLLDSVKHIRYISDPFYDAFIKALPKLPKGTWDWIPTEPGVLILYNFLLLYAFDKNKDGETSGMIYSFTPEGYLGGWSAVNGNKSYGHFKTTQMHDPMDGARHQIYFIHLMLFFMEHCEVQVKEWVPKSSTRIGFNKVENETRTKIEVIDSSWFTTLIAMREHDVEGHFRWQNYKDENGRSRKELIWIKDYKRGGLLRKAKKLKNKGL